MLYSLLVAVLVLSFFNAIFIPFMVIQYFVKGYNVKAEDKVEVSSITKAAFKKHKKPEFDKRTEQLLRNIDRYDGTPIGQEVIE